MALRYLLGFLGATLLLVGCGGGAPRTQISGKVSFKGAPVAQGQVTFFPKKGPVGSAKIVNGEYSTTIGGEGPGPGSGMVRIEGFDGKATPDQPAGQVLFYHEESIDLPTTASVKDLVVPASAPKVPGTASKQIIIP